jgi:phospholipid/cholesterol/gamma-HCH transport system ATP-binding protein
MTNADAAPAIALNDVHKSFGDQQVLRGLTLTIGRGERIAVLGRSGTGKSVMLKLIVGLQCPDAGAIAIDGQDLASLSRESLNELRLRIGFLFQDAALYDSLTVFDNVAFPLRRHARDGDSDQHVSQLLSAVGLEEDAGKLPAQMSGGMKKRAGLARALALDPKVLLFDEPTAGLDPVTAAEIAELVQTTRTEQRTSVVVTHDLRTARAMADRLVLLDEGTIAFDGSFEDLQRSDQPMARRYLEQGC